MAFEISELLSSKELPHDWSIGLVGDIAKVNATSISKKLPPKTIRYLDISSVGTRFFEKPKVLEYSEAPSRAQRVVKDGDTLISTVRPNLRAFTYVSNAGENLIASTGFACVTANDKNDSLYLHYFLTSEPFIQHLIRFADGAAYPAFDYKLIPLAEIPLPSPAERKNIGKFLGALDERIALLRETNVTLEKIAQALFKSWFVDFDPVRAKSEGKLPEGMDEATAALFPDAFEDTELGLVPKGWKNSNLSNVSDVGIGKTPPRKEAQWFSKDSSDVRWVSIRDMGTSGAYISNTSEFLTADAIDKFNVRRVPSNTVLLSFKMTIGRVAISDGEMTTNEAIAHCKLTSDSPLPSEYIYLHLKGFNYSSLSSTSSIADAVNSKTVKAIPILIPSAEVVASFKKIAGVLFEKIKNTHYQSQTLITLRDTLLPRLISGQLRIADAEAELEKVTA